MSGSGVGWIGTDEVRGSVPPWRAPLTADSVREALEGTDCPRHEWRRITGSWVVDWPARRAWRKLAGWWR